MSLEATHVDPSYISFISIDAFPHCRRLAQRHGRAPTDATKGINLSGQIQGGKPARCVPVLWLKVYTSKDSGPVAGDTPARRQIGESPSLPQSTSYGNDESDQSRHLHGSPKARHSSNTIALSHLIPPTAPSRNSLTGVKERTWLRSLIVVMVGMGLSSGMRLLR